MTRLRLPMVELKSEWFKLGLFPFSLFCQVKLDENIEHPITTDHLLPVRTRDFDDMDRGSPLLNGPERSFTPAR